MSTEEITPLVPREGWHVMHLFYHVDHAQWALYDDDEKRQAKIHLTELVQEIRATPDTHLLVFSVATPKADIGFAPWMCGERCSAQGLRPGLRPAGFQ